MGDNVKNSDFKPVGWRVADDVKDVFTDFCKAVGANYEDSCAGALVIWQYLPAQIREWAILEAKGQPAVDREFWLDFAAGLQLGLRAQQGSQPKKGG